MDMKEQAALTALRDEMRKTFEPFGARVEQLDIQLARRSLRWRARTPDYPSHHVGGAFEEWTTTSRTQHDRIVIVVVRDTALLDPANAEEHRALFESGTMPPRIARTNVWSVLPAFGLAIENPAIVVLPVARMWTSVG